MTVEKLSCGILNIFKWISDFNVPVIMYLKMHLRLMIFNKMFLNEHKSVYFSRYRSYVH